MFKNREEAGLLLGKKLKAAGTKPDLVLAIPRGGVAVGRALADILECPLDVLAVKKLGAPFNPELAIGAVAGIMTNKGFIEEAYWEEEICRMAGVEEKYKEEELRVKNYELRKRDAYLRDKKIFPDLLRETVVLTDDGVATGATAVAALRLLRKLNTKKIILAAPVIARDTLEKIEKEAGKIIHLEAPIGFYAVGQFYEEFGQVSDSEVKKILSS